MRADSTYIGRAPYQREAHYDFAQQWYQVPQVCVRRSNGDTGGCDYAPLDPDAAEHA